ncbi:MAG: type II and III secretion system protein [Pedosphaera sp.]|nr:type II and III secretion system protein [Pedosphaera sp.]
MEEVTAAVRNFFNAHGINLDPLLGKTLVFNDRAGELWVRATLQELDTIQDMIEVLNIVPHQISIKAKFAEITQTDTRALGFDWYLGNFLIGGGSALGSAGTQPTFNGLPSAANPAGSFPGLATAASGLLPAGDTRTPASLSDGLLTGALRNLANAPAVASFTGILTDPQFKTVIRAMEQRDGVDLLNAPEVMTPSGRQAQIQVVDIQTIVTGTQTGQNSGGGGGNTVTGGNQGGGGVGSTIDYPTEGVPFGSTLDVIPYISSDGYTIQMSIIPTITEFVGYDDPGQFVPQAQSVSSSGVSLPIRAQLPLPRIRVRQVTTSAIVWDGQTVVLGGLISEDVTRLKDKVPVLGDLPWVGKFFRSESSQTKKKNLVIFVTPTIIDPAGNRLHVDGEMPFDANTIPPGQTPAFDKK